MRTLYISLFLFYLMGVLCLRVIRCRGSGEYKLLCRISVTTWISFSFLFFLVGVVFFLEIVLEISHLFRWMAVMSRRGYVSSGRFSVFAELC